MNTDIPELLFRASSDYSHGVNEPNCFTSQIERLHPPPRRFELNGLRYNATPGAESPAMQLILALQRKHAPWNPFIFWTSSFPQAVIHGFYKDKTDPNVQISILNTRTATTPSGDVVTFRPVRILMLELGIKLTEGHTFEELDFKDVYVSTDIIIPGGGSSRTPLHSLMNLGLCYHVPELAVIYRTARGVASPIRNLREYWYRTDADLTPRELTSSAKLACLFSPVLFSESRDYVPMHVFAWFLAMKEQDPNHPRLMKWLKRHAEPLANDVHVTGLAQPIALKEVERFNAIYRIVGKWSVSIEEIKDLDSRISMTKVKAKMKHFEEMRSDIIAARKRKQDEWLASRRRAREERGVASAERAEEGAQMPEISDRDEEDDIENGEAETEEDGDVETDAEVEISDVFESRNLNGNDQLSCASSPESIDRDIEMSNASDSGILILSLGQCSASDQDGDIVLADSSDQIEPDEMHVATG